MSEKMKKNDPRLRLCARRLNAHVLPHFSPRPAGFDSSSRNLYSMISGFGKTMCCAYRLMRCRAASVVMAALDAAIHAARRRCPSPRRIKALEGWSRQSPNHSPGTAMTETLGGQPARPSGLTPYRSRGPYPAEAAPSAAAANWKAAQPRVETISSSPKPPISFRLSAASAPITA